MIYWKDINGAIQLERATIFSLINVRYGGLRTIHGIHYFGSHADCFLGHQLGGIADANNPPNISIQGFDRPWNAAPPARPNVSFNQDAGAHWIKGHLINGGWGGSGMDERNLVPLTARANNWHRGIENMLKRFLVCAYRYETYAPYKPHWYGIFYRVARSIDPLASVPNAANLYSYAPSHIGVSWRAVRFKKPDTAMTVRDALRVGFSDYKPVRDFPTDFGQYGEYRPPRELVRLGTTRPFTTELDEWDAEDNGFDSSIEVHNTV